MWTANPMGLMRGNNHKKWRRMMMRVLGKKKWILIYQKKILIIKIWQMVKRENYTKGQDQHVSKFGNF